MTGALDPDFSDTERKKSANIAPKKIKSKNIANPIWRVSSNLCVIRPLGPNVQWPVQRGTKMNLIVKIFVGYLSQCFTKTGSKDRTLDTQKNKWKIYYKKKSAF